MDLQSRLLSPTQRNKLPGSRWWEGQPLANWSGDNGNSGTWRASFGGDSHLFSEKGHQSKLPEPSRACIHVTAEIFHTELLLRLESLLLVDLKALGSRIPAA